MTRRFFVALCCAVSLLIVVYQSPEQALAASDVVATPMASAFDDCVHCFGCEEGLHDAEDGAGDEQWTRNGGAHLDNECRSGDCPSKHGPACDDTETPPLTSTDLESLRTGVLNRDGGLIGRIMATHRKQITLNEARSAIQVADCSGAVTVHMPVPSALLQSLALAAEPQ